MPEGAGSEEAAEAQAADIRRVAVIGAGTIGLRWAALFSHAGLAVDIHDSAVEAEPRLRAALPQLCAELDRVRPRAAAPGAIRFHGSLGEATREAGFVQECAPELLPLKQALLPEIEAALPADAVIASSSSAFLVSDLQRHCARPGRVVLGHPFNPAHLMPLVEVVGGEASDPAAAALACAFYRRVGKAPILLHREVPGHVALRLMAAMWREAVHLIATGVASAADIDRAFCFGPGPKWTLQGSFISNHLGAEGIEAFLAKYGDTYARLWEDLGTPRLDQATRDLIARGTREAVAGRDDGDLRAARDEGLIELLALQRRLGAFS